MTATEQVPAAEQKQNSNKHDANDTRHITFVIESLTVGGAERMVVDLANELSDRGDQVNVICLTSKGELADALASGIELIALNKKPGIDLSIVKRLRKTILDQKADVVNSHLWTANLWSRIAMVFSGVPVVVTEHNRDVWKRAHNKLIDRILSRVTAKLIAVSHDTADFYKHEVGVRESLVLVVNNGVDTKRYAAGNGGVVRQQLASDTDFLIGTVGRLAIQKNHPRLIEAAAILKKQEIPLQVVIAGDGPERVNTQAAITANNLDDCVTLLGERSDVPDLLAALDVFVLSSDREGHPLSALEAQAAGTPVVLTNAGGSEDAVAVSGDESGGVIVEKTPEAIAGTLRELAQDRSRLERMGRFAKHYAAEHFDKKTMIDKYSRLFDAVVVSTRKIDCS